MAETALDRLNRLLSLVPYLIENVGVGIDETAQYFSVSREQIIEDLSLLMVSGTPGYMPDDLIEVSWDDDCIMISNVQGISVPLRLGTHEAIALIAALNAMRDIPGLDDARPTIESALAKLTHLTGEAQDAIAIHLDSDVSEKTMSLLRQAIHDGKQVHLTYVSASDDMSERDVDPLAIMSSDDHWYLEAWCYLADSQRHFRLDRIVKATMLDTPVSHQPQGAVGTPVAPAGEGTTTVRLKIDPSVLWKVESLPTAVITQDKGSDIFVDIPVADMRWLRQFVLAEGDRIQVVSPPEARDALIEDARKALAAYETTANR